MQDLGHQLHNEPIFNLVYAHRRKYLLFHAEPGFSADPIPGINAMVGNILIQAQAGAQFRLGYNFSYDFGTTLLRGFDSIPILHYQRDKAGPNIGVYAFGSIGGSVVARNLSLDENTFQDSPHVEKRPFLPATEMGASLMARWFQATFSYVYWGKEFYGQQQDSRLVAVSVSWFF